MDGVHFTLVVPRFEEFQGDRFEIFGAVNLLHGLAATYWFLFWPQQVSMYMTSSSIVGGRLFM